MTIKVLIVDDSALVRQMLTELLTQDSEIEVVGSAPDPYIARERIKQLNPDVLTLDVEMPRMDGLKFLENLMRLRPMPVVMVSSLTQQGAQTTLDALELGAVDFVAKPTLGVSEGLEASAEELISKVKVAAKARPQARHEGKARPAVSKRPMGYETTDRLIAIGASTGGTEAVRFVLSQLSADAPGIVIAQHIPEAFSGSFAERLNKSSALSVCQASDGDQIRPGHAYVAPGDDHLEVRRSGARWYCRLHKGPVVNRHRPSVDVLFDSVARSAGHNACGVILTGMGDDGARGLKRMQEAGAWTLAQDEASSVVWGMPGAAVRMGGVDVQASLEEMPKRIDEFARRASSRAAVGR